MKWSSIVALVVSIGSAAAQSGPVQGFNYGNLKPTGELKVRADYVAEFTAAKNLNGTQGKYTSARLYTSVQGGGQAVPNEAIQAAIDTQTTLLLGLWCSAGDAVFANELASLKAALAQFGSSLKPLLVGISVGSEDLYRASILNQGTDPGADPTVIANYVRQVKAAVNAIPTFAGTLVGHVDTWNVYTMSSSAEVIQELDFLGMNAFPYFQSADDNSPQNTPALFAKGLAATQSVSQGKPVWVTETGWPVYGPTFNLAKAGVDIAEAYYKAVGCAQLFGKVNTWWYILLDGTNPPPVDTLAKTTIPSFGVVQPPLKDTTIYGMSCDNPNKTAVNTSVPLHSSAPSPVATPSLLIASDAPPAALTSPSTLITVPRPSSDPLASASPAVSSAVSPSASNATTSPTTGGCPADLNGPFEFPHLLIPVSSAQPTTAYGTQYFGTINSQTSSIYNFDINPDLAGKTCSLVFLFPSQTSATFNGQGGLSLTQLSGPATQSTTFATMPAANGTSGGVPTVSPGGSTVISSGPCAAGQTIAYQASATGGLDLHYFQDFNPAAPIGLYIRAC